MFVLSQYLLNATRSCKNAMQVSSYAIVIGLVLYASIYLYLLFYNNEYLSIFNTFIIYIIIVDLLLFGFYYYSMERRFIQRINEKNETFNLNTESDDSTSSSSETDTESDTDNESYTELEEETPDKFEEETPELLEQVTPDCFEEETPDRFEQVTPDRFEQETPDRFEQVTPELLEQDMTSQVSLQEKIKKKRGRKPNVVINQDE